MRETPLLVSVFAFLGCSLLGQAAPVSLSYTLELPYPANLATPAWLGHPETPAGAFASLNLPLTAPEPGEALLVTIAFQEKEGGFLRVIWKNAEGEQVLSNNFYEGIGMEDQRTLLIPSTVVQGGGTLRLQCGAATLDVQKIRLQWLEAAPALVSPDLTEEEVIPRPGKALPSSALDGQPPAETNASLDGSLITVPIASTPQRIEQGVEFSLQLNGAPQAARLSFEEAGLPWGRHLVVWINQHRAGPVTPAVPELGDTGFPPDVNQPYAGWRNGSIYLPTALLKKGLNALQFSVESDTDDTPDTTNPPLAVNHLVCQFDYSTPAPVTNTVSAALAPLPPLSLRTPFVSAAPLPDDDIATPGASAAANLLSPLTPTLP